MKPIEFKISGIATEIFEQVKGYTACVIPEPSDPEVDVLEVKVNHRLKMFTIYKSLVTLLDDYYLIKELSESDQHGYYVILSNIRFTDTTPTLVQQLAYEQLVNSVMNDRMNS